MEYLLANIILNNNIIFRNKNINIYTRKINIEKSNIEVK